MKRLVLVFALWICPMLCHAVWTEYDRTQDGGVNITLSTVTARVRAIVDDQYSVYGTVRYSSATIYGLINTAQRLFCSQVGLLETNATQTLTADTTEYTLPDNFLYPIRVTLDIFDDNGPQKIPQKTVKELDGETSSWAIDESSPTAYYIRNRRFGMYPYPQYSGAELAVWYVMYPSLMDSEDDVIFDDNPMYEPYWEALAAYAAWQIFIIEGQKEQAAVYVAIWNNTVSLASMVGGEDYDYKPDSTGRTYPEYHKRSH